MPTKNSFLTQAISKLIGTDIIESAGNVGVDLGAGKETFGGFLRNILRKWSGSGLTDADKQANQFNAQQAQLNRDFEERMSSTAYQRGIADMQAAGLNPALMYGSGSPASTPSGSAASASSSGAGTLGFGELVNALMLPMQLKSMRAGLRKTEADISNTEADTEKKNVEASHTALDNEFLRRTMDARIRSVELSNNLNDEQVANLIKAREKMDEQVELLKKQAKTEEERATLTYVEACLKTAQANQIAAMLPYQQELLKAQTKAQYAAAALSAVQTAYQKKLIDGGAIDAYIENLKAQAHSAEERAKIDEIHAKLRNGTLIDTADTKGLGKVLAKTVNGVVSTVVNLVDIAAPIAGPVLGLAAGSKIISAGVKGSPSSAFELASDSFAGMSDF